MENKETFFARLEPILSPNELLSVKGAYIFAKFGHRSQKRKEKGPDGKPLRYFEHVRRTAIIMIDELDERDPERISCALLHDCLENTEDITSELLENFFGKRVARTVRCLTNKPFKGYYNRLESSNMDVLITKLCDRTDNVRSLNVPPPPGIDKSFQKRKANETLDTYIPIFRNILGAKEMILISEIYNTCAKISKL